MTTIYSSCGFQCERTTLPYAFYGKKSFVSDLDGGIKTFFDNSPTFPMTRDSWHTKYARIS